MKKRGKITIWTIVIVAIVMVVGIIFFPRQSSLTNPESSGLPPVYLEYEVKSDGVGDSIEVVGNITAEIESVIPKVSGEIFEVYVEKGDVVEEGQILAKIDDLDYQIAYLNALNDYESSTNVGERLKEVKRLQLEKAKKNLEATEIKAPVSGIVNAVNISKNDIVGTTSVVLTIVDRNTIKVETAVDEIDFPFIYEGMDATIRIDPLNLEEPGKVTWISPTTQTDMGVVVIPIEIEFTQDNLQNNLISGMTADVEIVTLKLENTVAVPKDAIHEGVNGAKIVYKKTAEGGMEPVQVQTGKESDNMVEITEGLKPGDKVLILPSKEETQRIMQNYGIPFGVPVAPGAVPQGSGSRRGGF
ncbi:MULTISPECIES: efflux RND transporter periplasmic adaptor subunit [Petrotoga]|uniref:efflux RND transporter periplasmic adaptor subunit n=1 Tax=Petrotoga TaxID=28236 RepID=UPI000CDEFB9E|nr:MULTISPECIES: efflux RND transporter periplasmic adaptor subunit [Petrotoga]